MAERFSDAALRHLETAEILEGASRRDDAAYHYGLVGEMALKAAAIRVLGALPTAMRRHLNEQNRTTLQDAIAQHTQLFSALTSGRLGGAVGADLQTGVLGMRFDSWSINIRYDDDAHCPVSSTNIVVWKMDAIALYNNGIF